MEEDREGVTPALTTEAHDGEQAASEAARNAGIAPGENVLDDGPVIIEADEESDNIGDEPLIVEYPNQYPDAVSVEVESIGHRADDQDGGADHQFDVDNDTGMELNVHEAPFNDPTQPDDASDESLEHNMRRSRRRRQPSSRLTWDERNQGDVFAQYAHEDAEQKVDEYMHSMISKDLCGAVDSYLVPVFEFIITQYSIKSGLRKVRAGKDREAMQHMLTQYCMTQYSLKAGLKKFGKEGETAVSKELGQFHDLSVFIPMDPKELTIEQRAAALASLMFLKEKKDGTVKARACADGRKQRETTAEEDAASPTVSIESFFMTCAIEASEKKDVAIMDLPGAFLHADCNDNVIMKFVGRLAELMVLASPATYRKYVTINSKGEPVLFVKLQKALYGMLKSALLFYKKLLTNLIARGFTVNPYDPCVVTKIINGKQMTICWHVDDLKVSHGDENEVTRIENWLRGLYGNISVS